MNIMFDKQSLRAMTYFLSVAIALRMRGNFGSAFSSHGDGRLVNTEMNSCSAFQVRKHVIFNQ